VKLYYHLVKYNQFLNIFFLVCPIWLPLFPFSLSIAFHRLHPSSIGRDSNPRPFQREPSALTTRPGFSPKYNQFIPNNFIQKFVNSFIGSTLPSRAPRLSWSWSATRSSSAWTTTGSNSFTSQKKTVRSITGLRVNTLGLQNLFTCFSKFAYFDKKSSY